MFTFHAPEESMRRASEGGGDKPVITEERWSFAATSGERIELDLKYERGTARRSTQETRFFSSVDPKVQQIFKIEQGLDIMRNATVPVRDRVMAFSYKATGGRIAPLFDGSERVVSVDALHWYNRAVYSP